MRPVLGFFDHEGAGDGRFDAAVTCFEADVGELGRVDGGGLPAVRGMQFGVEVADEFAQQEREGEAGAARRPRHHDSDHLGGEPLRVEPRLDEQGEDVER
ncbi:hypothetical protein LUW76_36245 [Actinomadura madurae]|uniref:hypothetical protein n=1 Tax=Actinomadura madurae TaxID=1993 RepID=UPI0020263565|nr:hypothetical protein [Actinomadura madurae]URM99346.1 hypothetical protein LUW76_36245 [Actinomadura madurae]